MFNQRERRSKAVQEQNITTQRTTCSKAWGIPWTVAAGSSCPWDPPGENAGAGCSLHCYVFAFLDCFLASAFLTLSWLNILWLKFYHMQKGRLRTRRGRTIVSFSVSLWGKVFKDFGVENSLVGDCYHESFHYQEEKIGRWHTRYTAWNFLLLSNSTFQSWLFLWRWENR